MIPKISVIVPVYNAENNIEECVTAIQKQKYSNIEIILINDGSRDRSLELCKKLEKNDSRIKVISGENEGVSCARNKGVAEAKGDYIAFVDADDLVTLNIYTQLIEKASLGYDLVFCNYLELYESGECCEVDQLSHLGKEKAESRTIISNLISISENALFGAVWRTLFKADIIRDNNIEFSPGLTMAEDLQFLLKCLKYTDKVGLCLEYLYKFRVSNESTTGKYMPKQELDMRQVNDWMMEYVKSIPNNEALIEGVEICMANTLILNISNVCKKSTPYGLGGRIKYAKCLMDEKKYKMAIDIAIKSKTRIVKKRYYQILLIRYHLSFFNVIFHSIKNKTILKHKEFTKKKVIEY